MIVSIDNLLVIDRIILTVKISTVLSHNNERLDFFVALIFITSTINYLLIINNSEY